MPDTELAPAEELQADPPPRDGAAFRMIVGLIAVIGGLAGLALLFFVEVPVGNKDPLMLALGIVLGWGGAVINFEYGSSAGSRRKSEALEKMKGQG